jgi:hypothetical protein
MPYTIVFRTRNTQDVSAAEAKTRSSGDRDRRRPPKEERGDQVHNLAKEGEIGVECFGFWRKKEEELQASA